MSHYTYFVIPFENVPKDPPYTAWFATWTKERPTIEPGMNPPMVVGVIAGNTPPAGTALLGSGGLGSPPPPAIFGQSDYQTSVSKWLGALGGSANSSYFMIPFDKVPTNPTYTVWFATWSKSPPTLEPGMNPPIVVGVIAEDIAADKLPAGAFLLGSGDKDPLPPPPPPPPVTFSQSDYQRSISTWLALGRDEDE